MKIVFFISWYILVRLFLVPFVSVRSSVSRTYPWGVYLGFICAEYGLWMSMKSAKFLYFSRLSPLIARYIETKMASRTSKCSILTIMGENRGLWTAYVSERSRTMTSPFLKRTNASFFVVLFFFGSVLKGDIQLKKRNKLWLFSFLAGYSRARSS